MSDDGDSDELPPLVNGCARGSVRLQERRGNWSVVMPSTPASYFHALRRQVTRGLAKPLVVANPKKHLKYPRTVSELEEMGEGIDFARVLRDPLFGGNEAHRSVKKVIFCAGKTAVELMEEREKARVDNVAIVRIE